MVGLESLRRHDFDAITAHCAPADGTSTTCVDSCCLADAADWRTERQSNSLSRFQHPYEVAERRVDAAEYRVAPVLEHHC